MTGRLTLNPECPAESAEPYGQAALRGADRVKHEASMASPNGGRFEGLGQDESAQPEEPVALGARSRVTHAVAGAASRLSAMQMLVRVQRRTASRRPDRLPSGRHRAGEPFVRRADRRRRRKPSRSAARSPPWRCRTATAGTISHRRAASGGRRGWRRCRQREGGRAGPDHCVVRAQNGVILESRLERRLTPEVEEPPR
jgi:hypothetical protein